MLYICSVIIKHIQIMTLTTDHKNTLDLNFDMIVLATKKLEIKEDDFKSRFNEIIAEVSRMQIETYNKLFNNKELLDNAKTVMGAVVYNVNNLKDSLNKLK